MRFRCCLLLLGLAAGCRWDLGQSVCHPSVEERVTESLSGAIEPPAPPVVQAEFFRFAMFGDPQLHADLVHRLGDFRADVGPEGIDFCCILGDLTHDATAEEVQAVKAALDSLGIPYYATVGNHDLYQADGWARFKQHFGPSCNSLVVAGRVKLILLDSAEGRIGETQFDWLEQELREADGCIKVIGTHYPGYDGAAPSMYRLASATERYKLQHLLQVYRVYAYVAGHIHGWRHTLAGGVHHFIVGTMAPGELDYGRPGYLLLTFAGDSLSWEFVELAL